MSWSIAGEVYEASASVSGAGRYRVVVGGQPGSARPSAGIGDETVEVEVRVDRDGVLVMTMPGGRVVRASVSRSGDERWVSTGGRTLRAKWSSGRTRGSGESHGSLEAPMPGRIVRVAVAVGDLVKQGQTVVTLEAMKMEHALKAPRDGMVREVRCSEGELVQAGTALVVLEEAKA